MKIIEVRDGFIKFEADSNICLSSFVKIDGEEKSYIAQISRLQTIGTISIADAKILFIYKDNELMDYDKTEPPRDAEIDSFTFDILTNSIKAEKPIIIGKTLDNTCNIFVDSSAFDKKMLISVDDKNIHNTLIRNFEKQFEHINKKVVIIDTIGILSGKKVYAGVDFKLPLDSSCLSFMYESCLNDATSDSKSTIMDIFKDLSEYSKTVPFVPFGTLKSIIDDMVDKQHIFKLLVLKNKLAKFAKLGYFATSEKEVLALDNTLNSQCLIIDLSKLDTVFQNYYLEYIYKKLSKLSEIQVFLEASNTLSKKNLKMLISDSNVSMTLLTHSKFQYLNDIRTMFDNFIIEPSQTNNDIFRVYGSFLSSMQKNMYLTAGEAVNYIPIVSSAQVIDEFKETNEPTINNANSIDEQDYNEIALETDEEIENNEIEYYSKPLSNQTKIIEAINAKSDEAISFVTKSLDSSQSFELFNDEEEVEETSAETSDDNMIEEDEQQEAGKEDIQTELSEQDFISEEDLGQEEGPEDLTLETPEIKTDNENSSNLEKETIESFHDNQISDEFEEAEQVQEKEEENNVSEISEDNENILLEENEISETIEEPIPLQSDEENIINDNDEIPVLADENLEDSVENETLNDVAETEEMSVEIDNEDSLLIEESNDNTNIEDIPSESLDVTLDNLSEPTVLPISDDSVTSDFDEIVELDPSETNEDDIVVDLSDEDNSSEINEQVEQEIIDDVDKVYTTMKNDSSLEEISDSDLDFIDELNNNDEELEEYQGEDLEEVSDSGIIDDNLAQEIEESGIPEYSDAPEEILEKRDTSTPIVPVYDADIPQEDIVVSDPIQQGDAVVHAKYGNGVVEKMIKYGNKTLFAINFENIGRRLLDPTLTEIKRV